MGRLPGAIPGSKKNNAETANYPTVFPMEDSMSKEQIKRPRAVSRRTFLAGAAAATAGAATLGFPTIVDRKSVV